MAGAIENSSNTGSFIMEFTMNICFNHPHTNETLRTSWWLLITVVSFLVVLTVLLVIIIRYHHFKQWNRIGLLEFCGEVPSVHRTNCRLCHVFFCDCRGLQLGLLERPISTWDWMPEKSQSSSPTRITERRFFFCDMDGMAKGQTCTYRS